MRGVIGGLGGVFLTTAAALVGGAAASGQDQLDISRDVPYVVDGHERQKLDLYLPKQRDKPLPTVIWIHGGGWQGGDKGRTPALLLAERGYAVASVNYRLSQHAPFPAQIEDCKAALRFLRANAGKYNLDGARFGVWGASAGGHLVALLGTSGDVKELEGALGHPDQSSRVQCVINWFGPADFVQIGPALQREDSPVVKLFGGKYDDKKELYALGSPVTHATPDDPPFLIFHGTEDRLVHLRQSELLKEALEKAKAPVTLHVLEGAGHGGPQFTNAENRERILAFFDKHLRPADAAAPK